MARILRSQLWIVAAIGVCVVAALVTSLFFHSNARATTWSWTSATPEVAESAVVADISGQSTCAHEYNLVHVSSEATDKYVCRNDGGPIKVGVYFAADHYEYVVGFGDNMTMYPLYAIGCERFDSCLYLPETDTLVTRQYYWSGAYNLVIYKNFSSQLKKSTNLHTFSSEYSFTPTSADYTFTNSRGDPWQVGGIGASPNGKWLAVEFKQRGIGILNIETLEMRRIAALHFDYGLGSDPHAELAITDDGAHVAVMGTNAGIYEFEVADGCGEKVTDLVMFSIDIVDHPCKSSPINRFRLINGFMSALHPHFINDGAELQMYVHSYSGEQREVILRAAGYNGPRMDYLALGDSFTSGEGETSDAYYAAGTNDQFEKCHLSTRSYPYLISAYMGIEPQYMRSVACSGATMGDVVGEDEKYWGQERRLSIVGLNLDAGQKTLAQTAAKENFIPGRMHQLNFVKRYRPHVITIGIGGNDVGFMTKLQTCIGLDTCEWATSQRENTAKEVASIYPTLLNTYSEIQKASPNSKIYAVGYPKVIDKDGTCSLIDGLLLNKAERTFMDEGIVYINQIVKAAAQHAGIQYLDREDSLGGHVLCGRSSPAYMNDITFGDDIKLNDQLDWTKIIGQESFHPKPQAHELFVRAFTSQVPDLRTFNYCDGGLATCPLTTTSVPIGSQYWYENASSSPYALHAASVTSEAFDDQHASSQVTLADYSLQPGSQVQIEAHSDPVALESAVASDSGGLSTTITIPIDFPEGYHTLHILGTSFAGEPVDYYQLFTYLRTPKVASDSPIDSQQIESSSSTTNTNINTNAPTNSASTTQQSEPVSVVYKAGNSDKHASDRLVNTNQNSQLSSVAGQVPIQTDGKLLFIILIVVVGTLLLIVTSLLIYLRFKAH